MRAGIKESPADVAHAPQAMAPATLSELATDPAVTVILDQIDQNVTGTPLQISAVGPDTWTMLKACSEGKVYKLEYLTVFTKVTVLFDPIVGIARADSDYETETNRYMLLTGNEGWAELTPDFAFMKKGPIPKYGVIFECAWTQPREDLTSKVPKYFLDDNVEAVVCLFIERSTKYGSPAASVRRPETVESQEALIPKDRTPLSEVFFMDHQWGEKIKKITLSIFYQEGESIDFIDIDITPPASGADTTALDAVHLEFERELATILSGFMGDTNFLSALPRRADSARPIFGLAMEEFYR
ncbi:hypothetical protein C8J57DRAFT_1728252 [Mycena rebaudengoi]|nr:hypothetical protein C8J57DRAFT_1728252 [Mycena rebaudengoi]